MRWSSPVGNLPYAIYGQMIGEDESSYMPVKFLEQFGIEIWHPFADGALLQGWAEYIDTTCSANRSPPRYDCAYNQGRFNMEGYRYRGRVIGHTADRDTEGTTVGASLAQADGTLWSVSSRVMRLNRANGYDPTDTVASDLTWYRSLELGWRGRVFGDALDVTLGAESTETVTTDREIEPFGFVRWTHEFAR
jgi:hypothetical protein